MQRNSWICRRFSPTYNVLYDRFSNSLYPSSINGIKVGTHITHPYPSLSWKIIDNVPAGLFLPRSFAFCRFPFHRLPPRKNVLVPYLVISFLDNAPRDASNPFLPCFSPLPFHVFSQGLHTEYFDRPNCLARLIFIGPHGGEQVQRKHFKKRNFPAPPPCYQRSNDFYNNGGLT